MSIYTNAYGDPIVCRNCQYCDVTTGSDLVKRVKCYKTPRGKTIVWHTLCFNGNVYQYICDYLNKHDRPSWCPLCAGSKKKK